MSNSAENEHFSDGISEEIINALAKIDGLKVTSRTSAFQFKGKTLSIPEIAKQLGVSSILEGSVRLSGNALRITAQLIDATEDFHFWSETWDRSMENIFAVQDEISLLIAEKLREHIGHFEIEERPINRTTQASAYSWYLKSKHSFAKFQKADILLALQEIERAIEIDAECPFYHASKAIYYGYLGLVKAIPGAEAFSLSKDAALRALELDTKDPEANYAIGMVHYFFEKDVNTAVSYLKVALKHRPNYVNALLGGSVMDVVSGHYDRALDRLQKAFELDPLIPSHRYYLASALQRMGRYEEALIEADKVLKAIPDHSNSYYLKGIILSRLGRYKDAIAHFQHFPLGPYQEVEYSAGIGIVHATAGNKVLAEEYLQKLNQENQNLHLASEENPRLIIHAYLGNFDWAFDELEKDIRAGKYYLNFYREIPAFQLLAQDPRSSLFEQIFKSDGRSEETESTSSPKKVLLSQAQIASYKRQLLDYMNLEKPYLDASLSLRRLADQLKLSPNQLSLVLNEGLGKNFNNFINLYRIEEFKLIAKDPSYAHISIAGLAYDCGFNSKSVFNTYFKQITGHTPSEYLKG